MVQGPWGLVQSWDDLDREEQERLKTATEALDYFIHHEWKRREIGGAASVQYDLGRSEEWSPTMRAVFSTWYRDAGWHRVKYSDASDGTLIIYLEPS